MVHIAAAVYCFCSNRQWLGIALVSIFMLNFLLEIPFGHFWLLKACRKKYVMKYLDEYLDGKKKKNDIGRDFMRSYFSLARLMCMVGHFLTIYQIYNIADRLKNKEKFTALALSIVCISAPFVMNFSAMLVMRCGSYESHVYSNLPIYLRVLNMLRLTVFGILTTFKLNLYELVYLIIRILNITFLMLSSDKINKVQIWLVSYAESELGLNHQQIIGLRDQYSMMNFTFSSIPMLTL